MSAATEEAAHWQRVKALLGEALELSTVAQPGFIERVCKGDPQLHKELNSLLAAALSGRGQLDSMPAALALTAVEARTNQAWIGRRLGSYRIVSLIAAGGMGAVYRAERADGQYEQHVALKVMREGFDVGGLVSRFNTERQILASLDHPNLAKVLDGGVTDEGVPYFVMELVAGEPIDAYSERMRLSVSQRVQLFRSVCQVVHYAHKKGVVHRDLKVNNILVTHDGVVKLVDFGIAKRIDAGEPQIQTATAQRVMTLVYSSPEQVRGGEITPASDIYSLGVVLYRLLTQVSPYSATASDSAYELTRAICDTEPTPPSQAVTAADSQGSRRRLRGDLDAVVMMALRKEPERRYVSAESFSDDLFRHLEGLPVQARRGAWSYRAGRFVLRHRAIVGAAMVANLALVAGIGIASYQTWKAHQQRERAEHHFAGVRQLAHVFIFDIHDAIQNLPGSIAARKLVVETAIAYLQGLSSEAGEDVALQTEIAAGYGRVGDILVQMRDLDGAMGNFEKAKARLLALVASIGHDAGTGYAARRELAWVQVQQGALLVSLGRYEEADTTLRAALASTTTLAAAEPTNAAHRRQLATIHAHLSQMQFLSGDLSAYLRSFETAGGLLEAIVALKPDDYDAVRMLSALHDLRGQYLATRDDSIASGHAALVSLRKGLALMQRLNDEMPDRANVVRALAAAYNNVGAMLQRVGDIKGTADALRLSVGLLAGLTAADPRDMALLGAQAQVTSNLSDALRELGDTEASVATGREAVALFDKLPKGARMDVELQSMISTARYNLGLALDARAARRKAGFALRSTDVREACQHYGEAMGIVQAQNDRARILPGHLDPDMVRKAMRHCPPRR
jgi:eukaryotic-like serine/threonine-protein kinase